MPCNGPPMTTLTYCTLGAAARCFLHVRNMSFSKEHVIIQGTCHSPRNVSFSKGHVILTWSTHLPAVLRVRCVFIPHKQWTILSERLYPAA